MSIFLRHAYVGLGINAVLGLSFGWALSGCAGQSTLDERQLKTEALTPQTLNIASVQIEFAKPWLREQRFDSNPSNIEQLTEDYNRALTTALADFFSDKGWKVQAGDVDKNSNESINNNSPAQAQVTLKINDMRITAPDYRLMLSDLYVRDEIGSGKFNFTLTQNGQDQKMQEVLRCKDARTATFGSPNRLQKTNRGINQMAFKKELKQFLQQCVVGNQ